MIIVFGFIGLMCWIVVLAAALTGGAAWWMPLAPIAIIVALLIPGLAIEAVKALRRRI